MQRRSFVVALAVMLAAWGSVCWGAAPIVDVDSGVNSREWVVRSRPGTVEIIAVWTPARSVFNTEQFLIGECVRRDGLGFGVGKNKITFRNIVLAGVDSGNMADASNQREKLRGGIQIETATWYLTDAARSLFAQDSAVVIAGEVRVGGKVLALDQLVCALGVSEEPITGSSSSSRETEPFEGPLPAIEGVEVPRLLPAPARR